MADLIGQPEWRHPQRPVLRKDVVLKHGEPSF